MVKYIYGLQWFQGKDILIDIVSAGVLLLIAIFAIRYYYIKKNSNNLALSTAFSLLTASLVFKIILNLNIYSGAIFSILFMLYRLSTFGAVYVLYTIYRKQSISDIILASYFMLVVTYFTYNQYYAFYLTLFVMFALFTFDFSKRYINKKRFTTKLVAYGFGVITFSQIIFSLVTVRTLFYAVGELIQLVGYIILLIAFILVLTHGRKEDKSRHY